MILVKDENEVINRMSLFIHSSRRTMMKDSAIQTEYDEFYTTRMVHCCHQLPLFVVMAVAVVFLLIIIVLVN